MSFSRDFLSKTHSVGTGYELPTHGTLGKSSIITLVRSFYTLTFSEKEYLFVIVCVYFFLFFRQFFRASHYSFFKNAIYRIHWDLLCF